MKKQNIQLFLLEKVFADKWPVSNQNFVVQDVSNQENYISCGWKVKSEIVIPIFVNKENIGQIDIDSHTANVFTDKDEQLVRVCL